MAETLESGQDKDLAGDSAQFYSMTNESQPRGGSFSDRDAQTGAAIGTKKEKAKDDKENKGKEEKRKRHLIYWRVGIGSVILLIAAGVIYFIGAAFNWGVGKVSGQQPTVSYVPSLRSNADPGSSYPTEPVISNSNIYPVNSAASNSTNTTNSVSASGQVAGASHAANNCPDYVVENYYYCDWIDAYTFRPYRTKDEYDAAKALRASTPVTFQPASVYSTPPYTQTSTTYVPQTYIPPFAPSTPSVRAANNCPDYAASEYAYCIWYDRYTFRGFRAGE